MSVVRNGSGTWPQRLLHARPVLLVQGCDQKATPTGSTSMSFNSTGRAALPLRHLLLDGDLLLLVPHPPAPMIRRLAQRNAVDPGAQRGLAVKTVDAAKDLDENFLGQVGGVGLVAHRAREQRINRLMVVCDQPGKRLLRTRPQLCHESRFVGLERECAGKIAHGEVRLQVSTLPRYRTSSTVCTLPASHLITNETREGPPMES